MIFLCSIWIFDSLQKFYRPSEVHVSSSVRKLTSGWTYNLSFWNSLLPFFRKPVHQLVASVIQCLPLWNELSFCILAWGICRCFPKTEAALKVSFEWNQRLAVSSQQYLYTTMVPHWLDCWRLKWRIQGLEGGVGHFEGNLIIIIPSRYLYFRCVLIYTFRISVHFTD